MMSRKRPSKSTMVHSTKHVLLVAGLLGSTFAFQSHLMNCPATFLQARHRSTFFRFFSSVGGGPPPSSDDDDKGIWDDFLDPNKKESESLQKAREFISENSLPISFGHEEQEYEDERHADAANSSSSAIVGAYSTGDLASGEITKDMLEKNPYMAVVSRLSPSELISKFTATTHPRVQTAVRQTILGLIGGLPKMAFDTNIITTGQRLASLMFQLQMTGYMFKNAEYRLSLQQSLETPNQNLLLGTSVVDDEEEDGKLDPVSGKIRGKIRVKYDGLPDFGGSKKAETTMSDNDGVEVDAGAYMSELRSEVAKLREELVTTKKAKEDALRKDLLLYIRTLPEKELRALTGTMTPDVLVAMKGLVNAVMNGIGEGQITPDTITEQSGEAMAQLCMWQLAIGYNLRTLEVREEMRKSLTGSFNRSSESDEPAFE